LCWCSMCVCLYDEVNTGRVHGASSLFSSLCMSLLSMQNGNLTWSQLICFRSHNLDQNHWPSYFCAGRQPDMIPADLLPITLSWSKLCLLCSCTGRQPDMVTAHAFPILCLSAWRGEGETLWHELQRKEKENVGRQWKQWQSRSVM